MASAKMAVQGPHSLELAIMEPIAETVAPEILGLGDALNQPMNLGLRARTMSPQDTLACKWLRITGKTAVVRAQTMMARPTAAMGLATTQAVADNTSSQFVHWHKPMPAACAAR